MSVDDLPAGWASATVNDTGAYLNGLAFRPADWGDEGRPIIRIQNLTDDARPHNRTLRDVQSEYLVQPGDILVSWSATLDAFVWRGAEAVLNQHIFKVTPERRLFDSRLLFHMLRYEISRMTESEHLHGSTMRHINRKPFLGWPIAIPPMPEQVRIADEIEKQLSRIAAGVADLESIKSQLIRYRASVLKAACEGRLVPTETELARASRRDLPQESESKSADLGHEPPLAEGWRWVVLGDLIVRGPQNGIYLPKSRYGDGIPILRIDDFQVGSSRSSEFFRVVSATAGEQTDYALCDGDLVINRVNSPSHLGKCMAVESRHLPAIFESNMMRLRLVAAVSVKFIQLWLWSSAGRSRLVQRAKWAVNQASINQGDVRTTPVPLPPLAEQRRIVTEVERRLSIADQLAATIDAALARAARLRQSILKRAFEGRLVPQDPNDEPASVLLERIRKGREIAAHSEDRKPRPRARPATRAKRTSST